MHVHRWRWTLQGIHFLPLMFLISFWDFILILITIFLASNRRCFYFKYFSFPPYNPPMKPSPLSLKFMTSFLMSCNGTHICICIYIFILSIMFWVDIMLLVCVFGGRQFGFGPTIDVLFLGRNHLSHPQLCSVAYSSICRIEVFLCAVCLVHSHPVLLIFGQSFPWNFMAIASGITRRHSHSKRQNLLGLKIFPLLL